MKEFMGYKSFDTYFKIEGTSLDLTSTLEKKNLFY